jgi:hypothetical protein
VRVVNVYIGVSAENARFIAVFGRVESMRD